MQPKHDVKVQNPTVYMLINLFLWLSSTVISVVVKRACLINLVFRSGSFQVVQSFAADAGKLWFLNFIYSNV